MSGFKNFIMRGNLVELAVAVVIGTQFSNLVKQFVTSFINPVLSPVGGPANFTNLAYHHGKATFTYGQFLSESPAAVARPEAEADHHLTRSRAQPAPRQGDDARARPRCLNAPVTCPRAARPRWPARRDARLARRPAVRIPR
jgi:hypothetical protein